MSRSLLSGLLGLIFTLSLYAQQQYTVEVGAFQGATSQDFAEIKQLGFIYGNALPDNVTQVFIGIYDQLGKAETIATQLRARGFRNARVLQRPSGQNVVVIQLATKLLSGQPEWEQLERAGNLYVENQGEALKIMTGIYPDVATAQAGLPGVRQLGYRDAFVKTVNYGHLIPISTFETGIKKALIPIALNNNQPAVPSVYGPKSPATYGNVPNQPGVVYPNQNNPYNNQPGTYGTVPMNPGQPAVLPAAKLPTIRGRFKRESASKLQLVLKEKGFYTGLVDGYYGGGTSAAFDQAWERQEDIAKYRLLLALQEFPANDAIIRWPAAAVLKTVADDMSGGLGDEDLAVQSAANRLQLYASRQPLSVSATTRAQNWHNTLWTNLDRWAAEDPVHAHMQSAFRIAYFQTQVQLEDYYMDQGFASDNAKDLALATLQNMVGADLERFLY